MNWIKLVRDMIIEASAPEQLVDIYATLMWQINNKYEPRDYRKIPAPSVYKDAELSQADELAADRIMHEMHVSYPPLRHAAIKRLHGSGLGRTTIRLQVPFSESLERDILDVIYDLEYVFDDWEEITDWEISPSEDGGETFVTISSVSDLIKQFAIDEIVEAIG